jgi:hypothetical protein
MLKASFRGEPSRDKAGAFELAQGFLEMVMNKSPRVHDFVDLMSPKFRKLESVKPAVARTLTLVRTGAQRENEEAAERFFGQLDRLITSFLDDADGEREWAELLGNVTELFFVEALKKKYQNLPPPCFSREAYCTIYDSADHSKRVICTKPTDANVWDQYRGLGELLESKKTFETLSKGHRTERVQEKVEALVSFTVELDETFPGHGIFVALVTLADIVNPTHLLATLIGTDPQEPFPLKTMTFPDVANWLQAA